MICVRNSVIATEPYPDWSIYKSTIFQIAEKVRTNERQSPKYTIFEKKNLIQKP